jgi:branched-chain amino acid aminotransferase
LSKEPEFIWFDGKTVPANQAQVSVRTHSLHYGTAVFEGIRAYYEDNDLYVFRLKDHLRRLVESAKMIHLVTAFTVGELEDGVLALLKKNEFRTSVYIRPITFVGEGGISLDFRNLPKHTAIFAIPFAAYFEKSGLRLTVSPWRKISQTSLIPRAKAAGNYLNSSLATIEAKLAGYDEALLLEEDGRVSEGAGQNVFIVRDGVISTPPTYSSILEGITRDTIIKLAKDAGFVVVERPIDRSELYTADEVFFTGTACEVESVLEIDGRRINDGDPGKVTRLLKNSYSRVVSGRSRKYRNWLTSVYASPSRDDEHRKGS